MPRGSACPSICPRPPAPPPSGPVHHHRPGEERAPGPGPVCRGNAFWKHPPSRILGWLSGRKERAVHSVALVHRSCFHPTLHQPTSLLSPYSIAGEICCEEQIDPHSPSDYVFHETKTTSLLENAFHRNRNGLFRQMISFLHSVSANSFVSHFSRTSTPPDQFHTHLCGDLHRSDLPRSRILGKRTTIHHTSSVSPR